MKIIRNHRSCLCKKDGSFFSEVKMSNKAENFWYHNKLKVIIGGAFLLIFIICAVQIFNRTSYDLCALYAGSENINVSESGTATLYSQMEKSFKKISGDDSLEVSVQCFTWVNTELAKEYKTNGINYNSVDNDNVKQSFLTAIANGKCSILLLDSELYEEVKENGALEKLSDTLGYTPDNAADEYSVKLSDTDFGKYYDGFKKLPENTVLCLRNSQNGFSLLGISTDGDEWQKQVDIFKKIIEFKAN